MSLKRFFTMSTNKIYMKIGEKIISRAFVPEDKKSWDVNWSEYKPISFSLDFKSKPWADPDISDPNFHPKWNQIDGKVDRRSHQGKYQVVNGFPLNPLGRTAINLRGKLGRWGPNHAADPIVTRWKRNENGEIIKNSSSNRNILQFVGIERSDTKEWAIPGGMVDPGEKPQDTMKREFFEEALNALQLNEKSKSELEKRLEKLFSNKVEIFRGVVNDPRNTDNAWIETVAFNVHDENGDLDKIQLKAGDDAKNVKWIDIDNSQKLYADHAKYIYLTGKRLEAHW